VGREDSVREQRLQHGSGPRLATGREAWHRGQTNGEGPEEYGEPQAPIGRDEVEAATGDRAGHDRHLSPQS
jgi:hypothetical protein